MSLILKSYKAYIVGTVQVRRNYSIEDRALLSNVAVLT